jgi:TonB family protein
MIASWMLSAILFTALLGGAAVLAESALRTARRQARWPWVVALVAGAVWPLLAPLVRRAIHESPTMLDVAVVMPSVQVVPDALPGVPLSRWLDVALLSLWVVASVVAIARLVHAVVLLRRIRLACEQRIVDEVPVLVTENIGPAIIGLFNPRVLIPKSLLELDQPLRDLALRHELEHGRAHDQVALIGSAVALALVPWNLPLWWIVRRVRLAIEIDCDARVLARESNARQYGQLLMLISQAVQVPALAPMLVASRSHLERRVAAMIPITAQRRRTRIAVAVAGAIVVAIAACSSRISDVITGPKPEVATRATTPVNADQPWFEFQVNKPATQIPGTGNLRYPDELRRANVEGVVLAQFVVTASGDVEPGTFKELRSSDPLFTEAVKANLPSMKFYPAEVKGVRVKQLVQQPFTFALSKGVSMGAAMPKKAPEAFLGVIIPSSMPNQSPEAFVRANGERLAQQIPGTGNIRYPDELRAAHIEGEVIAQFVVDTNGTVSDGTFKAIKSNNPLFTDAVRNALPMMRFTPAVVRGKPVRQLLQQPFTFSLSKQ